MSQISRAAQDYANAQRCGMTVEEWQAARVQVKAARSRGKGTGAGKAAEGRLDDWGDVDGQLGMFEVE